jgi:hypothetical protein
VDGALCEVQLDPPAGLMPECMQTSDGSLRQQLLTLKDALLALNAMHRFMDYVTALS